MNLTISPAAAVPSLLRSRGFGGILSIGSPRAAIPDGVDLDDPRVLRLTFEDEPELGAPDGPTMSDVEEILMFGQLYAALDVPILVHCHAGVSRSAAAALLMLAQCLGPGRESEAVAALLASEGGHRAWPNGAMIRMGDEALDRDGALVRAAAREWSGR